MSENQLKVLPGAAESSTDNSDENYSCPDSGEGEVASCSSSALSGRRSALSAEAQDFIPSGGINARDPFGYQLSHPSPERNTVIAESTRPKPRSTTTSTPHSSSISEADDISNAIPGPYATLAFLPSSSSTGYTLSGLPIVTSAETLLYSASARCSSVNNQDNDIPEFTPRPRYYIPYLQLGYLELTDGLICRICPCDLAGIRCPHDDVFEWDWIEGRWEAGGGGCGMLRLCEALHANPPPLPPSFVFPVLLTHPDHLYRTTGSSGTLGKTRITPRASTLTTAMDFDPSYILSPSRPIKWTMRVLPLHKRPPPASFFPPDHPHHALHCPHLHSIPKSCSSINRCHPCVAVSRDKLCPHGHDFASTRTHSRAVMLPQHREGYVEKRGRPGTVFLDRLGRWCWKRKEVLWRVGEMVDARIGDEGSSWTECDE